jgi:phosphate starvation-inducible PhoH-like protein
MSKGKSRQARSDRRGSRQQPFQEPNYEAAFEDISEVVKPRKSKPLEAKNEAQGQLISNILGKDITFATGPAGTGKTYITATLALEALLSKRINKILITRPMQACGEDMGHLPGEIEDKYAPWVRPVLDVFRDHMTEGALTYALKNKKIEFCPLQFMRGSSFKHTWAILDEAQNITPEQMKMFLTRIGEGSKLIVSGDIRQSDLKDGRGVYHLSGLQDAVSRLHTVPEIGMVHFTREDIVRHGLVRKILDKYED